MVEVAGSIPAEPTNIGMNVRFEPIEFDGGRAHVIVCAACRLSDGLIIPGPRHFDATMRNLMRALGRDSQEHYRDADEGFINQYGHFLTREEARVIAERNGQLIDRASNGDWLYSEDIY